MNCYSCDHPATNACKRCARAYCEDHGNATYCAVCLQPASALPSFNLYRAALLTMLVGTAISVYLIMRPPGQSGDAAPVVVAQTTATPTPPGGGAETREPATVAATTPVETPTTAAETPTPASDEATPDPNATESPFNEYVVQDGDTLFDIAVANLPPGDDPVSFAEAIANLNGIDIDNPVLTPGQTLALPKPAP